MTPEEAQKVVQQWLAAREQLHQAEAQAEIAMDKVDAMFMELKIVKFSQ